MKYTGLFGWGIAIYALLRLVSDALLLYAPPSLLASHVIALVCLIIIATIAGRSLTFRSWTDILPYSLFWVLEIAVLDALFVVPFSGWMIYSDWNLWVGYALVALFPLLAPLTRLSYKEPAAFS